MTDTMDCEFERKMHFLRVAYLKPFAFDSAARNEVHRQFMRSSCDLTTNRNRLLIITGNEYEHGHGYFGGHRKWFFFVRSRHDKMNKKNTEKVCKDWKFNRYTPTIKLFTREITSIS